MTRIWSPRQRKLCKVTAMRKMRDVPHWWETQRAPFRNAEPLKKQLIEITHVQASAQMHRISISKDGAGLSVSLKSFPVIPILNQIQGTTQLDIEKGIGLNPLKMRATRTLLPPEEGLLLLWVQGTGSGLQKLKMKGTQGIIPNAVTFSPSSEACGPGALA